MLLLASQTVITVRYCLAYNFWGWPSRFINLWPMAGLDHLKLKTGQLNSKKPANLARLSHSTMETTFHHKSVIRDWSWLSKGWFRWPQSAAFSADGFLLIRIFFILLPTSAENACVRYRRLQKTLLAAVVWNLKPIVHARLSHSSHACLAQLFQDEQD